ncbi:MAG: cation-translocating P-type ATPase [Bacillota bacterium]
MLKTEEISSIKGLSRQEAEEKLKREGYNEIPSSKKRGTAHVILEVIREPMFLLLAACGTIYLALGDAREAFMLLGFVFIIMGITIIQERKTERALEALRDLSSPRALVIRDGVQKRIPGREVVRDDILALAEGDRVPADAVLIWGLNVSVDESLLTGESVPVRKKPADNGEGGETPRPGGDDLPYVYSGTLIVQGQGIARVLSTGSRTEIGKIGGAIQSLGQEQTLLQREVGRLVSGIAVFGLGLCAVVALVYAVTRGDWLHGLLAGVTLAMAMLPEEFPVVLTVFLALGALRMSHKKVLTRRMPAVETLGSATVLCVDKTGTLTFNRMSLNRIFVPGHHHRINGRKEPLPEIFHPLIEFGILSSKKDPFDPMEKALQQYGNHSLSHTEHLHRNWTLVQEYPLQSELLALSHVWKSPDRDDYVIAAKGAPEAIGDLCHLSGPEMAELHDQVNDMAGEGLRVLGVAKAEFTAEDLPVEQHDFTFQFLGLVGLSDPIRPTVPEAVKECRRAGIRVIMITGDYAGTARNIAGQIGLEHCEDIIAGSELDKMDDGELVFRIKTVDVFARVVPEQKLRIVNALKAAGEIVAMTGDGVNDAPALKSAHIGIAMGSRGTDVAREASSLVLLEDDFSSIVQAIRQGRKIFDNLKKAMTYILSIHIPIAGLSLLPVLFKWPLILLPVHIVFLELIIDPSCSIVFEAEREEDDIMRRPPRDPKEPLLGKRTVLLSILQGISVMAVATAIFAAALRHQDLSSDAARSLAFVTLMAANLGLIFANRSWSRTTMESLRNPNPALWWVLGGAVFFLALSFKVKALADLFHFAPLVPGDLAMVVGFGILSVAWFDILKILRRLSKKRPGK